MNTVELIDQIMAVMEASFDPARGEAWNRRQLTDALTLPNTFALLVSETGEEFGAWTSIEFRVQVLKCDDCDEDFITGFTSHEPAQRIQPSRSRSRG